jgi:3-oxoacyl-[acyl-carrier protein] reductase
VPAENLEALTVGDFDAVFGLNVRGSFQMVRAAVPALQQAQNAAIVNISSDSGLSGDGSSLAYAASKGALNTLTLGLARTLAPKIRVNAVCPGFVDTDWALAWQDEARHACFRDEVAALSPLKRMPSADDIAEAVEWLALGARCVTGQLIVIDAGAHLTAGSPMKPAVSA